MSNENPPKVDPRIEGADRRPEVRKGPEAKGEGQPDFATLVEKDRAEAEAQAAALEQGGVEVGAAAVKAGGDLAPAEQADNAAIISEGRDVTAKHREEIDRLAAEGSSPELAAARASIQKAEELLAERAKQDKPPEAAPASVEAAPATAAKPAAPEKAKPETDIDAIKKELLKKEGYVAVEASEILKTLDPKDVNKMQDLLLQGDTGKAELRQMLGAQMDKLAAVSAEKEKLAELKEKLADALQEKFQAMLDSEVSAKALEAMSLKDKAGAMGGTVARKMLKGIALSMGVGIAAAATIGSGGAAAGVTAAVLGAWRMFSERSETGKGLSAKMEKLTKPVTKKLAKIPFVGRIFEDSETASARFEKLRSEKRSDIVKQVLSADSMSGIVATTIRRESSKKIVAELSAVKAEAAKVETGAEPGVDKHEKALRRASPEFFRAALDKVKAEHPELSPEQQKEAATLIAATVGMFEKGQVLEAQALNKKEQAKPGFTDRFMETLGAVRGGVAKGASKEKQALFAWASIGVGTATALLARHSSVGRAITTGIAGGLAGYALGKSVEAKAQASIVVESERMIKEAEKAISVAEFPADKLNDFRVDAAKVLAQLESGMFDNQPGLKDRAENFIYQVEQMEMKQRGTMDQLLDNLTKSGDMVEAAKRADTAKLDKIYKSGQRKKILLTIGGAVIGAAAGYLTAEWQQSRADKRAVEERIARMEAEDKARAGMLKQQQLESQRLSDTEHARQLIEQQKAQQEMERVAGLASVGKGEGVTHALARQLKADETHAREYGFTGDWKDTKAVDRWAMLQSKRIAIQEGYIRPDGSQVRVHYKEGDPAQYFLKQEGGKFKVSEAHTEGHEYTWRARPPAVESIRQPLVESPKEWQPNNWQDALTRLKAGGSDPLLEERLRLNVARDMTPAEFADYRATLATRFEDHQTRIEELAQLKAMQMSEAHQPTLNQELLKSLVERQRIVQAQIDRDQPGIDALFKRDLMPRPDMPSLAGGHFQIAGTGGMEATFHKTPGGEYMLLTSNFSDQARATAEKSVLNGEWRSALEKLPKWDRTMMEKTIAFNAARVHSYERTLEMMRQNGMDHTPQYEAGVRILEVTKKSMREQLTAAAERNHLDRQQLLGVLRAERVPIKPAVAGAALEAADAAHGTTGGAGLTEARQPVVARGPAVETIRPTVLSPEGVDRLKDALAQKTGAQFQYDGAGEITGMNYPHSLSHGSWEILGRGWVGELHKAGMTNEQTREVGRLLDAIQAENTVSREMQAAAGSTTKEFGFLQADILDKTQRLDAMLSAAEEAAKKAAGPSAGDVALGILKNIRLNVGIVLVR